jgi:AcrR family transcriptional regulator
MENRYHHGNLRDEILIRAAEIIGESGIEALSLRAIAKGLGVSHGAPNRHFKNKAELLSSLATDAWYRAKTATLDAAQATGSNDAFIRLNAMGRGFLKWALDHPSFLAVIQHPDISRHRSTQLDAAMDEFQSTLFDAVVATQAEGRHPDVDPYLLMLFTNSVPYGLAALMHDSRLKASDLALDQETLIAELIELVVPIKDR